jgi:hypothetical protein
MTDGGELGRSNAVGPAVIRHRAFPFKNCDTAQSNDFEVRDSPAVAEAEGVPRQRHTNEEAPTLKDCL